jgi:hypothetical protein
MSTLRLSTATLGGAVAGCLLLSSCDFADRSAALNLACTEGDCSCTAGFGDCDDDIDNGCEIELRSDSQNCGGCGNRCVEATCEEGSCACLDGRADCDGDPENGCEVDLARDGTNCGGCGADCLGGACSAASCLPVVLEALATPAPRQLAVDDVNLYLSTWHGVMALPLAGGEVTSIATGQNEAWCIDVTDRHVIWRTNDGVWGATLHDKGPPLQVGAPFQIALAPTTYPYGRCITAWAEPSSSTHYVYWFADNQTQDGEDVRKATVSDETVVSVETLAPVASPRAINTDGTVVVWTDTPTGTNGSGVGLWTMLVAGGPASQPVAETYIWDVALADGWLYYSAYAEGALMRMLLDGSPPIPLATDQSFPASIAVDPDGTSLYWANECSGAIVTAPLLGGTPKVVADQGCSPHSVVVSHDSVYWIQWTDVMRLAK